jgi:hypothetical protein
MTVPLFADYAPARSKIKFEAGVIFSYLDFIERVKTEKEKREPALISAARCNCKSKKTISYSDIFQEFPIKLSPVGASGRYK